VRLEPRDTRNHRQTRTALLILVAAFVLIPAACKKPPAPQAKRYHLTGTVISVDVAHASANIDGQEIPGFMAAMTMPYQVRDVSALEKLSPGDQIKAEIVMATDGAYLENIARVQKAASPAPQ